MLRICWSAGSHLDDPGGLGFVQEDFEIFACLFGRDVIGAFDHADEFVDRAGLLQGLPDRAANTVEAVKAGQISDAATDRDDERFPGNDAGDDVVGADELRRGGHMQGL